jgi:large subunit ribosomal protein L15
MRLHDLKPRPGSKHRRKRLGQGESSGHGKTSGRGGKGQTARSGSSIRIGFEGGQMPLIRRIPKRGFNNAQFTIRFVPVNLQALNRFDDGATVDEKVLRETGLVNGGKRIKILGDGDLKKKLTIHAHSFSASARAKIEKLGGVCLLLHIGPEKPEPPKPAPRKPAPPKPEPSKTEPPKGDAKKDAPARAEKTKGASAKPPQTKGEARKPAPSTPLAAPKPGEGGSTPPAAPTDTAPPPAPPAA